jgi:hypothetical protein
VSSLACLGGLVVDRMFLKVCRMCPLTVASDFGKCLRTNSLVSPGQVVKPLSMALMNADSVGL